MLFMKKIFDVITAGITLVKEGKTPAVADATTAMAIYKTKEIPWNQEELKKIGEIQERLSKIADVVGK